jgi:hypothetical protein
VAVPAERCQLVLGGVDVQSSNGWHEYLLPINSASKSYCSIAFPVRLIPFYIIPPAPTQQVAEYRHLLVLSLLFVPSASNTTRQRNG